MKTFSEILGICLYFYLMIPATQKESQIYRNDASKAFG